MTIKQYRSGLRPAAAKPIPDKQTMSPATSIKKTFHKAPPAPQLDCPPPLLDIEQEALNILEGSHRVVLLEVENELQKLEVKLDLIIELKKIEEPLGERIAILKSFLYALHGVEEPFEEDEAPDTSIEPVEEPQEPSKPRRTKKTTSNLQDFE